MILAEGRKMATADGGSGALILSRKILLYGLLLVLSLSFFALVRDNPFWHSSDFYLIDQSIETSGSLGHIFVSGPTQPFQPLVKFIFFLEYKLFGLDAWKYYLFNIFIHSINAFLVFLLVFTLLKDRTIAVLSSVLFACAVGNYGKAVMVVSGISDLTITMLTLLTLFFYFKNELEKGGRVQSVWFILCIVCFLLSLLTKATSFSILGCMFAFNFFFRTETRKQTLHRNFMIIADIAFVALIVKLSLLSGMNIYKDLHFHPRAFLRSFGGYLVRMIFPIHGSDLVSESNVVVRFLYRVASEIRILTFLVILSYSVFGFIFGNRTIRFFIAWTYITVLPFCFFRFPSDWLNIRYLYLVSIGFIMVLASGTALASRLLYQKAWRRFLPYLLPALFVFLSQFIIYHLDQNYEKKGQHPRIQRLKSSVLEHERLLQQRE
jgi:hypothetical protein